MSETEVLPAAGSEETTFELGTWIGPAHPAGQLAKLLEESADRLAGLRHILPQPALALAPPTRE